MCQNTLMYNNEQQFIMSSGFTWLLTVKKLAKLQEIRIVGSYFFIIWLESPRVDFSVHPSFHLPQLHFHWSLLTATSPQSYPTFAIGIIILLKTLPPPPPQKIDEPVPDFLLLKQTGNIQDTSPFHLSQTASNKTVTHRVQIGVMTMMMMMASINLQYQSTY